jgi:hypothetical protein
MRYHEVPRQLQPNSGNKMNVIEKFPEENVNFGVKINFLKLDKCSLK